MIDEILPGERHQPANAGLGVAVLEVQIEFGGADRRIGLLKHGKIESLLVAEVMIEHALVDAGALGDGVDPRSA